MTSESIAHTAPAAPATSVGPASSRRPRIDPRYLAPILITLILVGSNLAFGILESPLKTGLAIVTAIGLEALLGRLFYQRWPNVASAYVSGISVGILVRSPYYWPYALTSAIAICSKYLFKYKGRHIFNPSNFAIVMMLLLAPKAVATLSIQWGNTLWLMLPIWMVGFMVLYKLKRLHITLAYILSFIFYAALRAPLTGDGFWTELAPLTGPMYQLFAMFMVTDPATTVASRRGQIFVVFLVATMECFLRLNEVVHAPYYALFLVGPPALVFDRWRRGRVQPAAAGLSPAQA